MRSLLLLSVLLGVGASAQAQAPAKFATITGQVKWNGEKPPVLAPVDVKVDQKVCCAAGPLLPTNQVVDPKSMGVKNVIVWLRPGLAPDDTDRLKTFPLDKINPALLKPKTVQHVIDQPTCQFEPRVLAAREGDTLVVKNSAEIPHNINYSSDAESLNVLMPKQSEIKLKNALVAQRTPVAFKCDIHPWMQGRVRVFDHPYFATTDKDGKFEIKDAPVGKWRIVYWHEDGFHKGKEGILGFPVEIKGDKATVELDPIKLELPAASK